MAKVTYLNQDSYFINDKGEFYFFEKGTSSEFYSHLKRLTEESPELTRKRKDDGVDDCIEKIKSKQHSLLKANYIFKGRSIQADSYSLNALIAAKESGNDPIKWYDAKNEPIMLTHNEICELITKISTRNGKIVKEIQLAKTELNKCENMKRLKAWEEKYGIE